MVLHTSGRKASWTAPGPDRAGRKNLLRTHKVGPKFFPLSQDVRTCHGPGGMNTSPTPARKPLVFGPHIFLTDAAQKSQPLPARDVMSGILFAPPASPPPGKRSGRPSFLFSVEKNRKEDSIMSCPKCNKQMMLHTFKDEDGNWICEWMCVECPYSVSS